MKIKYFGTAAAEGIPAAFACGCDTCNEARKLGGKNIRTRTQSLIDDFLLVDFPADTYCHELYGGLNLKDIRNCLITHSHSDHLYPGELWSRTINICYPSTSEPLIFYTGKSGYDLIKKEMDLYPGLETRINVKLIEEFKPFKINDYTITPFPANHDELSSPFVFLIEKGGKSLFYGNDTGMLYDNVFEYLLKTKKHIDLVSLDCTCGILKDKDVGHMSFDVVLRLIEKLESMNVIDKKTVRVINHFSHNGLANYDTMSKISEKYSIITAYDGMTVEF